MAASTASGGDGRTRVRARERTEEGDELEGVSERGQGVRGDVLGVGAAIGSRTWPGAWAGASGTRPPAYWHEVEDGGGCGAAEASPPLLFPPLARPCGDGRIIGGVGE